MREREACEGERERGTRALPSTRVERERKRGKLGRERDYSPKTCKARRERETSSTFNKRLAKREGERERENQVQNERERESGVVQRREESRHLITCQLAVGIC